jgi:hypothetical protein
MEPKELQMIQHQFIDAIRVEPIGLAKTALQACYDPFGQKALDL